MGCTSPHVSHFQILYPGTKGYGIRWHLVTDSVSPEGADGSRCTHAASAVVGRGTTALACPIGQDLGLDGKGTLTGQELTRLLAFLDATAEQKRRLLALGVEARKRPVPRRYRDLLHDSYERLVDLELLASELCYYERGIIPGLLQTPEYVEAIMLDGDGIWWESSWPERHNRVKFRLERQKLIMDAEPAKTMRFVIAEDALRTEAGGPEIMARQMGYLLSLVERPNINIRVISPTVRHNPAPGAGLTLLRLGAELLPVCLMPQVYGPSTYLDHPVDVDRVARAFDKIEQLAMSTAESRKFILQLAKGSTR
jgi:hypothetical protein